MQALTELREIVRDGDGERRAEYLEGWIRRWVAGRYIDCEVVEGSEELRAKKFRACAEAFVRDLLAAERLLWLGPSPEPKTRGETYRLGFSFLAAKPLE
jgi:hypothetical protein